MSEPSVNRRAYDAPGRRAAALATRLRICRSAEALFVRDGYARTTIRAVATTAGVSEATVYLAFTNKAALLDATIVQAVTEGPGPGLAEVLAAPPAGILRRYCELHAAVMHRAARLIAIGEGAALMDAELRPLRDRAHHRLREMARTVADRLDGEGLLRPGVTPADAADTIHAIASDATYLRLIDGCGHPPHLYADWLTGTLEAGLLVRG